MNCKRTEVYPDKSSPSTFERFLREPVLRLAGLVNCTKLWSILLWENVPHLFQLNLTLFVSVSRNGKRSAWKAYPRVLATAFSYFPFRVWKSYFGGFFSYFRKACLSGIISLDGMIVVRYFTKVFRAQRMLKIDRSLLRIWCRKKRTQYPVHILFELPQYRTVVRYHLHEPHVSQNFSNSGVSNDFVSRAPRVWTRWSMAGYHVRYTICLFWIQQSYTVSHWRGSSSRMVMEVPTTLGQGDVMVIRLYSLTLQKDQSYFRRLVKNLIRNERMVFSTSRLWLSRVSKGTPT